MIINIRLVSSSHMSAAGFQATARVRRHIVGGGGVERLHVPEWSTGQWSRPTYRYRTDMAISIPIISPATPRTWAIVGSAAAAGGGTGEDYYLEYIDGHYKINSVYGHKQEQRHREYRTSIDLVPEGSAAQS